ncbi:hypothetical protein D9758_010430 [Tetrapyrgos nigripes]|uniref:Protein kinase domain-containing protein n=1 Tax=Tetrapyrgos nigripes TaxID=182062 RepID=A0A8H5CNM5_9AGAR|nr:hypothetical protein D9758_010430 [Tetrapyrgos nigripes]
MSCPYYPGVVYQLQLRPQRAAGSLEDPETIQLSIKVLDVFQPITISPVLKVALASASPSIPTTLTSTMVLKVYDRRYANDLREFYDASDLTLESENAFRAYMSSEDTGSRRTLNEWTVKRRVDDDHDVEPRPEETEAYLAALLTSYYENEVCVYERMASMQGKEIPLFLGRTRFAEVDTHPDMADTEVPGILLEYVHGTPLDKLPANAISSDLCQKCLDIVQAFGDNGILNQDVRLENFIVPDPSIYTVQERLVVMIDFAQTRLRREDEDDQQWKRAKWSADEEGAVGYVLKKKFGWDYKPTFRYMVPEEE